MKIKGGDIQLTGDEVANAIDSYLVDHGIYVYGPRTVTVNGQLCREGRVYVDTSGKINVSPFLREKS